jgi:very-short-patch-repair endonuclease
VRQAPVGPYFVDFLCRERSLVVEVDGATHSTVAEIASDKLREAHLAALGFRVFRVDDEDVFSNIDGVLDELLAVADQRS